MPHATFRTPRATCLLRVSLSVLWLGGCGRGASRPQPLPNILLVTIDTFRADRLGIGVAPTLDRLAASGVRFMSARAAVPLTLPSHTTMLTGLLPPVHGVRQNGIEPLSERQPTVAQMLKAAGYQTAAFVGAFVLDRRFGLARGFDTYDDRIPRDPNATERLEAERPASAVVDRALVWFDAMHRAPGTEHPAPFFVWIHLYDPHAPYTPPAAFVRRGERDSESLRYEGEIAYADSQIARVFDWLRSHALDDRTLVVVAGDHGEGLGDHGERTHGMLLYESTLRVPLVVAVPGRRAARRDDPVSLVDIAPTILRAAGMTPPDAMKGRDLLGAVRLQPDVPSRPDLYAETEYPRVAGWSPLHALTDGRWMAIRSARWTELYDLRTDPLEQHDVSASQGSTTAALAARIDAIRAGGASSTDAGPVSSEAAERLRALGYVASSAQPSVSSRGPNPASMIATWNAFEDALSHLNSHRADALPALKSLAAANPEAPVFQTTYARALKDAGQRQAALAAYRAAAERWPTDGALLHDLAVAARDAAHATETHASPALLDEAARAEAAAIALSADNATAHNGLGLVAIDQDRPQSAVAEFERAAALDPNNASYWANLGNARRATHDAAGAGQAYRRALDVDPGTLDAVNGLGVLLVEARRPGEAVAWFERAVAAAPDFAEARLNLGIALQQSGQSARAVEAYRAVIGAPGGPTREKKAAAKLLAALGASR